MDIRYSCNQRDFKRYTTQETRDEFLITDLYQPDQVCLQPCGPDGHLGLHAGEGSGSH